MSVNQAGVYTATSILISITTITVGLRLKARKIKKVPLGPDDISVLLVLALDWALAIILLVGAANNVLGTHSLIDPVTQKLITKPEDGESSKYNYVFQIFVVLGDGALKMSLLLLYRRIFVGLWFTRISNSLIVLIVLWTTCFFFGTIFWCGPNPVVFWTSSADVARYCGDYKSLQLAHAVSDVATDLIVLAIPIPIIYGLHLRLSQKTGLILTFLLGFTSTGAGIARMVFVLKYAYETATGARDIRGIVTETSVWGFVEVTVGTITACLVTFRPLINLRSLDSVINSVRSALSLRSWNSGTHDNSRSRETAAAVTGPNKDLGHRAPYTQFGSSTEVNGPGGDVSLAPPRTAILAQTKVEINETYI